MQPINQMDNFTKSQITKDVLDILENHGYQYDGKGFADNAVLYFFKTTTGSHEFAIRRGVVNRYRLKEIASTGTRVIRAWDSLDTAEDLLQGLHGVRAA